MVRKFFRIGSYIIIASWIATTTLQSVRADDTPVKTPFSEMAGDTYDGYPLFPQGVDGDKFHYATSGIDVRGSYNGWTGVLTYTVTEGDSTVTRSEYLSHSGYRMIHGINYNQNLFVVSYRR